MKKFLKWLIPCLVACFMVVGLVQTASFVSAEQQEVTPDQNQANVPVPAHEKSISGDEENGYTLTLNVKGQKETIPGQKPKLDVVLVIDQSGSMTTNDMTGYSSRMDALKNIITSANGLSQAILGNENLDARMAVVTYSGSKTSEDYTDSANNDADIISGWIGNYTDGSFNKNAYSSINESVKTITTGGGTNCEAGLIKASEVFSQSRINAQKYLIFLSDGTPTYYYANGEDYYKKTDEIVLSFTEQEIPEGTLDPNEEGITVEQYGTTDVIYGKHTVWEGWIPVTKTEWYSIGQRDIGWHYIEEEGVGVWKYGKYSYDFATEKYEEGITLGAGDSDSKGWGEIPVPEGEGFNKICSKRAYDAVSKLSGLDGFYTVGVAGKADEAFLKGLLTYSDAKDPKYFPGTDTAKLTKAFSDIANNIVNRSLTVSNVTITDTLSDYVNLSSSVVDGIVTNPVISIKNDKNEDVTNEEKNAAGMVVRYDETAKTVTCVFKEGYSLKANYTYSVSFGVVPSQKAYTEFSKNNGSYGNELEGFESNGLATLTYTYGDIQSSSPNKVEYEQKPVIHVSANNLSVTKEVKGAYANKNDVFKFTLTLKDEERNPVNDTLGGIKFVDGKYEFTLTNGQTVEFKNLPRNYSYEVNEKNYDGYKTTYLTGTESNSNKPSSEAPSGTFTYGNKDGVSVTVTNTAEAVPLTGITDNTPKGLGLIGSIVVEIAAIAFVLKKKRQLKM